MLGIILIAIALTLGILTGMFNKVPNQKITSGEIISIEQKKTLGCERKVSKAYIEYYVDGARYIMKSKYWSEDFRVGLNLRIKYNKLNPSQADIAPDILIYMNVIGLIVAGIKVLYLMYIN